jgi:hypothetical protein
LAVIAAALGEFVRDNDLGVSVDRCLCVRGTPTWVIKGRGTPAKVIPTSPKILELGKMR